MKHKILLALGIGTLAAIVGCTAEIPKKEFDSPILSPADRDSAIRASEVDAPQTYVRKKDPLIDTLAKPVSAKDLALRTVIGNALPQYQLSIGDGEVDLGHAVTLSTPSMPVKDFLEQLGLQTGYDLSLQGNQIVASAWMTKEWLLPAFSIKSKNGAKVFTANGAGGQTGVTVQNSGSSTSTGGSQSGSTGGSGTGDEGIRAEFTTELDEWEALIDNCKTIIGAKTATPGSVSTDSAGAPVGNLAPGTSATKARVVSTRSQGFISAYGPVPKMRQLDRFLNKLQFNSSRQVILDVRAIEIQLTHQKQLGIDWTAVANQSFNAITKPGASITVGNSAPPAGIATGGAFSINVTSGFRDNSISAMLQFLSQYGDVEMRNEPQITALNGRPAYIGSGNEFGFVASVEQVVSNGTVALTPTLQRILIGVSLSVTPHVQDDGQIMMDVVPVVSSFQGFDNFTIAGSTFSQPRIELQQLATTVITRSGQSRILGGLITRTITKNLKQLPIGDQQSLGIADMLFADKENELQRSELVLIITPRIVNG